MKATSEAAFETLIEQHLLTSGYVSRPPSAYDANLALMPADLFAYVQHKQPKRWAKVKAILGAKTEATFLDAFNKAVKLSGVLKVLREGFKFYGKTFRVATFKPTSGINAAVLKDYAANTLAVVRQVHHNPAHPMRSVDIVLFLNGIPLVTIELKNAITGQHAEHAVAQYKRRSANAPLFRFKQRALVHFAVGTDEAHYTTQLTGKDTYFLPFNRGQTSDGEYVRGQTTQAGNPGLPHKHPTCYLWEEVWQRDNLLELFGRFLHIQVEEKTDAQGLPYKRETMIFPRFHQWDCVKLLAERVVADPAGTNYLVQHSTGSGKSNSIAWLAHRLAFLHSATDEKRFDCVVVITDRKVLDQQLQSTIYQVDKKQGVVERIDKDSKQLAEALVGGLPIIITTLHKFGFIVDHVGTLPERRYAIIVDEAHSSQSGKMATNMKALLGASSIAAKLEEELADADDEATPDQSVLRAAISRGPQLNLSFFAFTATPKFKTLKMFGHVGKNGKPSAIHLYSMRQAIEEGFVLDVLRGYTTYSRYFKLIKAVSDDPTLDKKKASQALARFVNLHPTNLAQHTEVIVEHFRTAVMHRLGGRAKAMVVTASRLEAVRFKRHFEKYITDNGYSDMGVLVAFSGKVIDPDEPASEIKPYTEPDMNRDPLTGTPLQESELPEAFAGNRYNVLIVANKYQTGFDQPMLCAMYVIKRLSGIQAVQTLSRLNRIAPGKTNTFVLDFVNKRADILESFQAFYEGTTIAQDVSPQRLYELQTQLDDAQVYHLNEVELFAKVFFKPAAKQQPIDNAKLNAAIKPARDRFTAKLEDDEDAAEAWRGMLTAFCNLYGFLSQIIPFADEDLEKRYVFGRRLLVSLPKAGGSPPPELDEDVALQAYRLQLELSGNLGLSSQGKGQLKGPEDTGTGQPTAEVSPLSQLIESFNERFATDFDAGDFINDAVDKLTEDEDLRQIALANDKSNFALAGQDAVDDILIERHAQHTTFVNHLFDDKNANLLDFLRRVMLNEVHKRINQGAASAG